MSVHTRFQRLSLLAASTLGALTLVLILILAVSVPSLAAGGPLLQLSSDPYTNSTSQHQSAVEPDTLAFGSTMVTAFQVGRFFDGGASNIGFATSTTGGTDFTSGFLPGTTPFSTPAGIYARTSDPSVAFDAKDGVWLISFLGLFPNGNRAEVDVLVSRSTNGRVWSSPVVVNADGHSNDKNWTVCDTSASSPFYGQCYTEFDDTTLFDLILMSTSTDGGQTWGAALPTGNNAHGIGGQPLVQPSGTVIVPIVSFAGFHFRIVSFTSNDGGASWSFIHFIARVAFHHAAGGIRDGFPLPSAAMDQTGKVYVVWQDCHFEAGCTASDLVLSTSTDGKAWSKLTRIPLDPVGSGVDHFIPGLAVDSATSGGAAHLVLTYYFYPVANCTTATCQLEVGVSTSADGGASWTAPTLLAGPMALTWLPNTTQGFMVGDYVATAFSGAPAYPAFALANAPSGSTFDEAMYTVRGGVRVGGSTKEASDQTDASSNDPLTSSTLTAQ